MLSGGRLLMISKYFIAKYVASVLCNRQAKERPPVIHIIVRQPPQMVQIHCVLALQQVCHAQGYLMVLLCRPHLYFIAKYVAPIQGGRQAREMPHAVHCHSPPNSSNASDALCIGTPTSLPWSWYSDGVVVSRQHCLPCINYLTMACTHQMIISCLPCPHIECIRSIHISHAISHQPTSIEQVDCQVSWVDNCLISCVVDITLQDGRLVECWPLKPF